MEKHKAPLALTEEQLTQLRTLKYQLWNAAHEFDRACSVGTDLLPHKFIIAMVEVSSVLDKVMVPNHDRVKEFYWQISDLFFGEYYDVLPSVVQSAMRAAIEVVEPTDVSVCGMVQEQSRSCRNC